MYNIEDYYTPLNQRKRLSDEELKKEIEQKLK